MWTVDEDRGPKPSTEVLIAVAIAAGSALTVGLIEWAIDALKTRKGKP